MFSKRTFNILKVLKKINEILYLNILHINDWNYIRNKPRYVRIVTIDKMQQLFSKSISFR